MHFVQRFMTIDYSNKNKVQFICSNSLNIRSETEQQALNKASLKPYLCFCKCCLGTG